MLRTGVARRVVSVRERSEAYSIFPWSVSKGDYIRGGEGGVWGGDGRTTTRPRIADAVEEEDEDESFVRRRPTRPGRRITFPVVVDPVVVVVDDALEVAAAVAVGVNGDVGVAAAAVVAESEEPAAGRQIIT